MGFLMIGCGRGEKVVNVRMSVCTNECTNETVRGCRNVYKRSSVSRYVSYGWRPR